MISQKTQEDRSENIDADFSYLHNFNKKFSIFFKSQYLLYLLEINDNNKNIFYSNSNGINTTNINKSVYGYFVAGIKLKL